ncbi:MAG: hypothetical protein M1575_02835 [Patescibacteria group bacterium]|nr:hypothetical protein [Patescibacteria group bacterium]MCL5095640.1 hypothetical protein [Patescibacteria group bacterium]
MTEPIKKTAHLVLVYYFSDMFYVVGAVEMPPIFVWRQVNPIITVKNHNRDKLADAIGVARLISKSRFHPDHANPEIKPWDGEHERVWNNSSKSWSIWWNEDGSVDMSLDEPYDPNEPDLGEGKAWRSIKGAKKHLSPPVSTKDIAREILKQL